MGRRCRSLQHAHALTRAIGTQEAVQVETLEMALLPEDTSLGCIDALFAQEYDLTISGR